MIQGIIFDCFGVLSTGSLTYLANLASPENRQAVYDINLRADYGHISHDDYVRLVAELVQLPPGDIERIFNEQHIRNAPLVDFIRTLRPQYKTALLSNVGQSVMHMIFSPEELDELFDVAILSSDVGVVKPNPEIYQITAAKLGLPPEQCVMIDDIPRNVEGGEMVGMKGILYGSNEQLHADLRRLIEV